MAKPKKKLKVRLPKYVTPRWKWRRQIQDAVLAEQARRAISYSGSDHLEIRLRIYLEEPALSMHDVDNRLKDVMDALQGTVGLAGKKRVRAIIPNDSQVWRVVVEKGPPPWQSHGLGHLVVRRYRVR
jgi:Holliday junction resolvase RusA-like endonuclease